MARNVPFDSKYDLIRRLEKSAFYLLIVSAILILANWTISKFFNPTINTEYEHAKDLAKVVSYVSMICYLIIKLVAKILFHNVEKLKRNDLIDNAFGTNYSDANTTEYYNNDDSEYGIKKLALNSYESSFHTENTLKLMLYKNLIILAVISIPFFLSIFSKCGSDIVRMLFEISIPLTLISEFIKNSDSKLGLTHFAISVGSKDKVDSLTESIRKSGYNINGEPRTTGDGYYESVISDPEGNRIEITV